MKKKTILECAFLGLASGMAGIPFLIAVPCIAVYAGYEYRKEEKYKRDLNMALSYWLRYKKK
jgi:hypothetical protein